MLAYLCKAVFIYKAKYRLKYRINRIRDEGWLNGWGVHPKVKRFIVNSLTPHESLRLFDLKCALQDLRKRKRSFYCCIILILISVSRTAYQ